MHEGQTNGRFADIRQRFDAFLLIAVYQCMCYPDNDKFECLPVFSPMGGTGQIIDDQIISEREALKEATKAGFLSLAECYRAKDWKRIVIFKKCSAEHSRSADRKFGI